MPKQMTDLEKVAEGLRKHAEKHAGEMLSTLDLFFTVCMKESQELHAKIDSLTKELSDCKEEIEQQVDVIIEQKNELAKRD